MSPEAEFYWQGAALGELRYQVCNSCAEVVFHPRALCPYCLSFDLRVEVSAGRGSIYSFSVVCHATNPAFAEKVPYAVGIVELDEGFHMFTEIVTGDVDDIAIADRVDVEFHPVAGGATLPIFRRREP
jgi:uncharacterized protein